MRPFALVLLAACAGATSTSTSTSPSTSGAEEPLVDRRHGHRHGHPHDFGDVERFEAIFDAPDRDEWQRPGELVALMALEPGATVVDLGAGTGYFLRYLAGAVGPEGKVLALDTEPAMVEHMRARVAREGLSNVEVRAVAPDDPGLAPASVDAVLVVDTWHHIANRRRYAARLKSALRPGGALWIVDFTEDAPDGPPPEMRLAPEQVLAELTDAGLQAEILDEELPRQYVIRAR